MAAPKHHGCRGDCEKEVFDAKNAKIAGAVGVPAGCPTLTAAEIAQIEADIVEQFKGEIETTCADKDTWQCQYGAQPPWPAAYDTLNLDWSAEKVIGAKTCKYTFKATVDTASVTVPGKCRTKAGKTIKGSSRIGG